MAEIGYDASAHSLDPSRPQCIRLLFKDKWIHIRKMCSPEDQESELYIQLCVNALDFIHNLKHSESCNPAVVTVDLGMLKHWYDTLDDKTRNKLFADRELLRSSMVFEHFYNRIIQPSAMPSQRFMRVDTSHLFVPHTTTQKVLKAVKLDTSPPIHEPF